MNVSLQKQLSSHVKIATKIVDEERLSEEYMREYSGMKYGQVEATRQIAKALFSNIVASPKIIEMLSGNSPLFISSAAYGAVPTASHAIMKGVVAQFARLGTKIRTFKVVREGGFRQANYGSLDVSSRERSMQSRRVFITEDVENLISNQNILIIDDLFATGAHEASLIRLLSKYTKVENLVFAYPIIFESQFGKNSPSFESALNRAQVKTIDDLSALLKSSDHPLILNSRLTKFILLQARYNRNKVLEFMGELGAEYCLKVYSAAISSDAYFAFPEFRQGFEILKEAMVRLDVDGTL